MNGFSTIEFDKKTPLELAKYLIKTEVERGDSIGSIMSSQQGMGGPGYHMSIGGWTPENRIKNDKILVSEAQGKIINKIFSLREIYNMVKKEQKQPTLL